MSGSSEALPDVSCMGSALQHNDWGHCQLQMSCIAPDLQHSCAIVVMSAGKPGESLGSKHASQVFDQRVAMNGMTAT